MVTGANYLLETDKAKILVDCGMTQGVKHAEDINYKPFTYNPEDIDYVFITHAHIDHIGLLPKLAKNGFHGKIFMTHPTKDLTYLNLMDSEEIIWHEAEKEGRESLYDTNDVKKVFEYVKTFGYDELQDIDKGVSFKFNNAGHILGSAIIELWLDDGGQKKKFVFTGDLGNSSVVLLNTFQYIDEADYVFIESAYGGRIHEDISTRKDKLENIVEKSIGDGGVLLMPSFALERAQEMIFELDTLFDANSIPKCPVYIDSPLAIKMTKVYEKFPEFLNKQARDEISMKTFVESKRVHFTDTVEESKKINQVNPPKIIIAGSGMSTGGRILFHERLYLPDPKNTILMIGYQVAGTLGRKLLDHVSPVYIFGEKTPVNASVKAIGGYSAHADQNDLLSWISHFKKRPLKVFVTQGEEKSEIALRDAIRDHVGFDAYAPMLDETFIA